MNDSQKRQIEMARRESEHKSSSIDATGQHSAGYKVNSTKAFNELDRVMAKQCGHYDDGMKNQMPMYQKDGVS